MIQDDEKPKKSLNFRLRDSLISDPSVKNDNDRVHDPELPGKSSLTFRKQHSIIPIELGSFSSDTELQEDAPTPPTSRKSSSLFVTEKNVEWMEESEAGDCVHGSRQIHEPHNGESWNKTFFGRESLYRNIKKFTKKEHDVQTVAGTLHKYDPAVNEGLRTCCVYRGTIFERIARHRSFIIEMLFYFLLFFVAFGAGYLDQCYNYLEPIKLRGIEGIMSLTRWLLTGYIGYEIARWWRLRTDGIGSIWAGSSNLAIMIAAHFPGATGQDKRIRETIKRYCRASIATLFHRYGQTHFTWNDINLRGTLTSKEIATLKKQGSYPEAIWSWIGSYLADIYKAGLLPCVVYQNCLDQVAKGRGGAGLIGAQMGCQLPLTYVHAVNFMVKFGNVIITLQQGYELAKNIYYPDKNKAIFNTDGSMRYEFKTQPWEANHKKITDLKYVTWILSSLFSVLVMTTLYNAMLVVAASLSNPFDQDRLSFPGLWYEKGVDEDARFFHNMALDKPWKYQKFHTVSATQPGRDDTTSDSEQEGPQDLKTLITRMSKLGSSQSVSRRLSPKDASGRSQPPNQGGGKGMYSPNNTFRSA